MTFDPMEKDLIRRLWPITWNLSEFICWSVIISAALYFPLRMILPAIKGGM